MLRWILLISWWTRSVLSAVVGNGDEMLLRLEDAKAQINTVFAKPGTGALGVGSGQHLGAATTFPINLHDFSAISANAETFDAGSFGKLIIDGLLYISESTKVLAAHRVGEVGRPLVIKHMNDCASRARSLADGQMAMGMEFVISRLVSGKEIVPEMHWMSGLSLLSRQMGFDMKVPQLKVCVTAFGRMRTVVQDRVGQSGVI